MRILVIIGLIGLVLALLAAGIWIEMQAWNYVGPRFGLPQLAWLEVLCVNVVAGSIGGAFNASVSSALRSKSK